MNAKWIAVVLLSSALLLEAYNACAMAAAHQCASCAVPCSHSSNSLPAKGSCCKETNRWDAIITSFEFSSSRVSQSIHIGLINGATSIAPVRSVVVRIRPFEEIPYTSPPPISNSSRAPPAS